MIIYVFNMENYMYVFIWLLLSSIDSSLTASTPTAPSTPTTGCGNPTNSSDRYTRFDNVPVSRLPVSKTTFNTTLNVACPSGFNQYGVTSITCRLDGTWSSSNFSCVRIDCGRVVDIPNAVAVPPSRTTYRSITTYTCKPGYRVENKTSDYEATATCTVNGKWQNLDGTCEPIDCEIWGGPTKNILVTYTTNTTFNSTAIATCNYGYHVIGNRSVVNQTATCQADGNWTAMSYCDCERINCGEWTGVNSHNNRSYNNDTKFDSTAIVACDTGYHIKGQQGVFTQTARCLASGNWNSSRYLECEQTDCGNWASKARNAQKASTNGTIYMSTVTATCDNGYHIVGSPSNTSESATCEANGQWSKATFTGCERVDCGEWTGVNSHNNRSYNNDTKFHSIATVACDTGYHVKGRQGVFTQTARCLAPGNWDSSGYLECEQTDCGSWLGPSGHNNISYRNDTRYKSTAQSTCDEGYHIDGQNGLFLESSQCSASGSWTPLNYTGCEQIDCGHPRQPSNGSVSHSQTIYNSTGQVDCNMGYNLTGDSSITCTQYGNWSSDKYKCSIVDCGVPSLPGNGSVGHNETTYNANGWVTCNTGYSLVGASSISCTQYGNWSSGNYRCDIVDCGPPRGPDHGSVAHTQTTFNATGGISCDTGYNLKGHSSIKCTQYGNWSSNNYTCQIVDCARPRPPENGSMKYNETTYNSTGQVACNTGYHLIGESSIVCTQYGNWSSNNYSCQLVDCGKNASTIHGHITYLNNTSTYNSIANYTCDEGYELKGPSTIVCNVDGVWNDTSECRIKDCGSLPSIPDGKYNASSTTFNSRANLTCDPGYELNGSAFIICHANGSWSSPLSTECVIKDCGPWPGNMSFSDSRHINGNKTTVNSTVAVTCWTGYHIIGQRNVTSQSTICEPNGQWSKSSFTGCQRIDCSSWTGNNANTNVSYNTDTMFNSNAAATCYTGYYVINKKNESVETATCLANGTWSPPTFSGCEIIDCGNWTTTVANLNITYLNGSHYGSTVEVTCQTDYHIVGGKPTKAVENATCSADGTWNPKTFSGCEHVATTTPLSTITAVEPTTRTSPSSTTYTATPPSSSIAMSPPQTTTPEVISKTKPPLSTTTMRPSPTTTLQMISTTKPPSSTTAMPSSPTMTPQVTSNMKPASLTKTIQPPTTTPEVTSTTKPQTSSTTIPPPTTTPDVTSTTNPSSSATTMPKPATPTQKGTTAKPLTTIISGTRTLPTSSIASLIECGITPLIRHGIYDAINTTFQRQANLTCEPGYVINGSTFITCKYNGTWSTDLPTTCDPIDCRAPISPENGHVYTTHTTFKAHGNITCNAGYFLMGNSVTECLSNGQWSTTKYSCSPIDCGSWNGTFGHNTIEYSNGTVYNSTATSVCYSGYRVNNTSKTNETSMCLENGQWSTLQYSACVPVDCGFWNGTTENNSITYSNGTIYKSTATSLCDDGYRVNNTDMTNETAMCLEDGQWNMSHYSACVPVDCGFWNGTIENNSITYSNGTIYKSTATSLCDDGYRVNNTDMTNETAMCLEDGQWNMSHYSACVPVDCGFWNGTIENNKITYSNGTFYKSTATSLCDDGYRVNNTDMTNETAMCLEDGQWNMSHYSACVPVDCRAPTWPTNGQVSTTNTTFKAQGNVTCNNGYFLVGGSVTECLSNGQWNYTQDSCSPVDCGSWNGTSKNNNIAYSNGTVYESRATSVCDKGYRVNNTEKSNETAICLEDGQWSMQNYSACVSVDCGLWNGTIGNSIISYSNGTVYNSTATSVCDTGYRVSNTDKANETAMCLHNGRWSTPQYSACVPVDCGLWNGTSGNNNITYSNGTVYNSTATSVCDIGYRVANTEKSNETAICLENGRWSTPHFSTCAPVDCGPWTGTDLNNTLSNPSNTTTYKSVIVSLCDIGYHIINNTGVSSESTTCQANKTWSRATYRGCEAATCPVISTKNRVVMHEQQHVHSSGNFIAGDVLTFKCNDTDYRISGYSTIRCLPSGEWSGNPPRCVKMEETTSDCSNDTDSRGTQWSQTSPGAIAGHICPKDFIGEISRKCSTKGVWLDPVYDCVSKAIEEIASTIEAISETPSKETVTDALEKLSTITATKNRTNEQPIYSGEIEKVTNILESIVNISEKGQIEVTETQAQSFIATTSNLLDTSNTESWQSMAQDNEETTQTKKPVGATAVLDVVSRYTDALSNTLTDNSTNQTINAPNLVVHVSKIDELSTEDVKYPGQSNPNNLTSSIHLPKDSIKGCKKYSAVVYKNLAGILSSKTSASNNSTNKDKINSEVVAVSVDGWKNVSNFTININLQYLDSGLSDPKCMFLQEKQSTWNSSGCTLTKTSGNTCRCNHLTNFAILMSPFEKDNVDSKAIDIITLVGCSVSVLALIVTVVVHFALWRYLKSDRAVILVNLSVALIISYGLFIAGVDRTENKDVCTSMAVLLQYTYLVVFFLMLAEGIEIAWSMLYVFSTRSRLKILLPAAWLLPAVIVGISLGATQLEGYGNEQFCWLSIDNGLIWAFVGPALLVIVINFVLLVLVMKAMFGAHSLSQKSNSERAKAGVRCLGILLPLMGCTWVLGIFYVNEDMGWIQYVFSVVNGLQGFVIFLFHCALNRQIKIAIRRRHRKLVDSMLLTHTRSRTKSTTFASQSGVDNGKDSEGDIHQPSDSYQDPTSTSKPGENWREQAALYELSGGYRKSFDYF